jgi:ER lumen protein retaining receptor
MRKKDPWRATYESDNDTSKHWMWFFGGSAGLGAVLTLVSVSMSFGFFYYMREYFWVTSIVLESVAIMPQLLMLMRHKQVENLTSNYIFALGVYRGFYIVNWIYKFVGGHYVSWISVVFGVVQTALYTDFFYYYYKSKSTGLKGVILAQ